MALTEKQKLFVQEYLIDFNAAAAVRRAGYTTQKAAKERGYALLQDSAIQEAVKAAIEARMERVQLNQDWVVKRLMALADSNATRVAKWDDGGLAVLPSESLAWEDSYTISEVEMKETIKTSGSGDGEEIILNRRVKVKQVDKKGALELLGKHLGMFDDKLPDPAPDSKPPDQAALEEMTKEQRDAWIERIAKGDEPRKRN